MKKFLALVLFMAPLLLSGTSDAVIARAPNYPVRLVFDNTSTGNVNEFSDLIAACPGMYLDFKQSTDAVISVYNVSPTDNTAALIEANTRITQLNESKVFGPFTPVKSFIRLIVDRRESNSTPSTVDVSCGTSVANYAVPSPPTTADLDNLTATVNTTSGPVKFGWGISSEGNPPGFTAKRYPGSSLDGSENNHMMGFYYNKGGVLSSTIPNPFEHSYDFSVETAYRGTAQTSDQTLMEWNWDHYPPDHVVTTTGSSTAGWTFLDVLSFSGGGSGRVYSVSGSDPTKTIIVRSDYGTYAVGETITNITRGGTAVVATMTPDPNRLVTTTSGGTSLRSFLYTYNTLVNTASFDFYTGYGGFPNVSIGAGLLRHNGFVVPGVVLKGTQSLVTTAISAGTCSTAITTAVTGALSTDVVRWSYNASPGTTGQLVVNPIPSTNLITWQQCNPTAGSITPSATVNYRLDRDA